MIFVSTGGYKTIPASKICKEMTEVGIKNIELSGGLYDPNLLNNISKIKNSAVLQVHNYFPPPEKPFVFNLASLDNEVAKISLNHALNAIYFASLIGSNIYSFHAGFLLDPKPSELGKKIKSRELFNRELSTKIFIDRVNKLAEYAKSLGIYLFIENNVISKKTFEEFQTDPFLMTTASECREIMRNVPSNVKLLVDVAHLKVSSKSLGFDPKDFLTICDEWIEGYHLSDNDGTRDSNEPISINSWFWPYLKKNISFYTLEVYGVPLSKLIEQIVLVKSKKLY